LREGTPPAPPPTVAPAKPPPAKPPTVAEADRVRLSGMPTSGGWLVTFDIADPQVREIFYALDPAQAYTSTGFHAHRHPATGLPLPQQQIQLPGALGQQRDLSLKYTDSEGREHGPYRLHFDPKREYVRFTKSVLGMTAWLSFREYPRGKLLVYFTHLLGYKNALREIRYSVDDDTLSATLRFATDWSGRDAPGIRDGETTYLEIPMSSRFVAVRLSFIDGTESELKRISISESGISR
jgi:hypothetical protein